MSQLNKLKKTTSLHGVADLLGYQPKYLSYIIYKMPVKYRVFTIPKASGGLRTISAPYPQLKLLQSRLSDVLQGCWDEINSKKEIEKPISHGFRRGFSILTNASVHRGRRFVFNIDIKDFFDSINFERVYGYFLRNNNFELTEDVAKVLAAIVCHNDKLPQGSPCSPIISNLIGQILDIRLAQLARRVGCSYSRYADDLTFSTNKRVFPQSIAIKDEAGIWEVGHKLSTIIQKSGFQLNPKKTRMQYWDSRQEVTGLIVNRRINTTSEMRRLIRAMTHKLVTTGKYQITEMTADATGAIVPTQVEGSINHLQGMFGFIDWIDLNHRKSTGAISESPSSISKTYRRFLMHRDFWASTSPVILCEGKTDSVYLRGAMRRLAGAHPKLVTIPVSGNAEYKVRFFNYSYTSQRILDLSGGADVVKKFITSYIKSVKDTPVPTNQNPLILLLDNDSGGKSFYGLINSVTKTTIDGMADFYYLAANVYVVFTPINKPGENSSIEDFFDPDLLKTKLNGKSLNLSNNQIDESTEYGKAAFAKNVVQPNISKINFDKFDSILTRIEKAIDAQNKKFKPII
jgi:RNA-directed DNA polymerase